MAARHLGQVNGTYLTEGSLPSESWLVLEYERKAIKRDVPGLDHLHQSLDHPLVRQVFPDHIASTLFHLWEEHDLILSNIYDRLPQTFGHMDAHRFNLFSRRNTDETETTVAIDWAYTGIGAIGQEPMVLVTRSLGFLLVEADKAQDLDGIIFEGYLNGLHDVGWKGDPRQVRYGYTALSAITWLRVSVRLIATMLDESKHAESERRLKHSFGKIMDSCSKIYQYVFQLTDETRDLSRVLF